MANYQNASNRNSSNKLVAPGAQAAIDQMKFEIASEFGVNLGPDATARAKNICWWRNHKTFSTIS